ncbi:MAG TPA: AMP-binding protein [Phenylobacterium sp.]|uniref:AMP-binding protein n=1 Tax=Phenylobacterium sp. TaxID=1871053 RepID=UPI002F922573
MSGPFYAQLEGFSDRVALIEGDAKISYADLTLSAQRISDQIGVERRLIFLEARNDSASIAAYLACLRGAHPVYLFGRSDSARAEILAERYQPNAILRVRDGLTEVEWRRRAPHQLHPELRVLLSTSGSTGSPKFVKLSELNIQSNAEAIAEYLNLTGEDRAATSLNFNYSYGMSVVNSHLAVGGSLLLTERSVSEPAFWTEFEAAGATSFAGVPYTFELLRGAGQAWSRLSSLRYVTQAGGRLAPELVRYFAQLGAADSWHFFVMYGQTEAAPRIAYLPPELAEAYPDCIGVAIPGGELSLLDAEGRPIIEAGVEGELAYRGANVMMGYALSSEGLSTSETPPLLLTGDIALRNHRGLYRIVGRTSRIVKPFGVRINLDELQDQVRESFPGAVCAGTDERIVVACPSVADEFEMSALRNRLAATHNLPSFLFNARAVREIPLLSNGKADLQAILALGDGGGGELTVERGAGLTALRRIASVLGLSSKSEAGGPQSVSAVFSAYLGARPITDESTFETLAGDSLCYVRIQLALEEYMGALPVDWHQWTVADLESLRRGENVAVRRAATSALTIQSTASALLPAIRRFNERMEAGRSPWRFYDTEIPDWLAPRSGTRASRSYHVAVDSRGEVRGGFVLKEQEFLLNGANVTVANTQGPVSEGVVNPAFGALGAILLAEALERQPLQFGWGSSARKAEVLAQAGWPSRRVPILLQIVNAQALLRQSPLVRRNPLMASVADALVATGLGSLGNRLLQKLAAAPRSSMPAFASYEEEEFGRWADQIWEAGRGAYRFLAIRDAQALNELMPAGKWPHAIALRVEVAGKTVGWAALRDHQLKADPTFGGLRVGSVIDMLAVPGREQVVAAAASNHLKKRGADVVGTIVSHDRWIQAFRSAGFVALPGRRNISFSPALAVEAGGFEATVQGAHLTLVDGDGPRLF